MGTSGVPTQGGLGAGLWDYKYPPHCGLSPAPAGETSSLAFFPGLQGLSPSLGFPLCPLLLLRYKGWRQTGRRDRTSLYLSTLSQAMAAFSPALLCLGALGCLWGE